MNPVYILLPYLFKIQFNIILLSVFEVSKIFVPLRVIFACLFMSPVCYMSRLQVVNEFIKICIRGAGYEVTLR